jgi:hypothetical protein
MKNIHVAAIGLALVAGIVGLSLRTTHEEDVQAAKDRLREAQPLIDKNKVDIDKLDAMLLAWIYDDAVNDEMSGKKVKLAAIYSKNILTFGFPYDGKQRAMLKLQAHPRWGKAVSLRIERGQIISKTVLVRFDDGAPVTFTTAEAESGKPDIIFINNYPAFVARMKRAQKVRIEFTVYQDGQQVAEFDVAGFDPDFLEKK